MYGHLAASTLGYIVGDVPGAVTAYKLYDKYSGKPRESLPKSMKRQRSESHVHANSSGKYVKKNKKHKKSHKKTKKGSTKVFKAKKASTSRTTNVSTGVRKRSIKKLHKTHDANRVKVTPLLRKKVQKVITGDDPKGYAQYTNCSKATPPPASNAQFSGPILGRTIDSVQGNFFTPTQVNCAASVMWHGRTPASTVTYADANMFPWTQTRIRVLKQWATVKWRNNGQRTCIIKMYAGINKVNRASGSNLYNEWAAAMTEDATANVNVIANDPTTLYATPYLNKSVTNNWKIETTTIYLKPGEEYTYSIEGPSKLYDYRRFWQGTTQWPTPRDTVSLMYSMYQDLIGETGSASSASRLATAPTNAYGCIYEVNEYYRIEMPTQAGVLWATAGSGNTGSNTLPADGNISYLGARRDVFFIKNFSTSSLFTSTAARLDIENSAQGEAPPVG